MEEPITNITTTLRFDDNGRATWDATERRELGLEDADRIFVQAELSILKVDGQPAVRYLGSDEGGHDDD